MRNWDKAGKLIPHHTGSNGYRYYSEEQLNQVLMIKPKAKTVIGYCRVSSPKHKDDLERQIENVKMYLQAQGKPFEAIKDCVDAYQKFFKGQSGRARFNSKRRGEFSFYQDTDKIRITATHVKLEAIATSKRRNRQRLNWVRLAERGRIPVGAKYAQPRITFDELNRWLSVAIEFPNPKPAENCGEALGIDFGIKNLATSSDGTVYPNINRTLTARKLKKKQRRLQRSISRKYIMNKKDLL